MCDVGGAIKICTGVARAGDAVVLTKLRLVSSHRAPDTSVCCGVVVVSRRTVNCKVMRCITFKMQQKFLFPGHTWSATYLLGYKRQKRHQLPVSPNKKDFPTKTPSLELNVWYVSLTVFNIFVINGSGCKSTSTRKIPFTVIGERFPLVSVCQGQRVIPITKPKCIWAYSFFSIGTGSWHYGIQNTLHTYSFCLAHE